MQEKLCQISLELVHEYNCFRFYCTGIYQMNLILTSPCFIRTGITFMNFEVQYTLLDFTKTISSTVHRRRDVGTTFAGFKFPAQTFRNRSELEPAN